MKIGLGSTNKAKLEATENAVEDFIGNKGSVEVFDVDSPDQPMSTAEARKGALQRAKQAFENNCNLGIGNEGFVNEIGGDYFLSAVTVLYREDVVGEGYSGMIKLPQSIQERLPDEEIAKVIMQEIGENISEEGGAISVLTDGRKTRSEFTYTSMLHAFSEFQN